MSAGSAVFCYDANGNRSQEIDGSTTHYTYDAENRMTTVSGAATATFVYDGDGNRVKGVVGGVTTTYIENYFEWSGSTSAMKRYYYAGGTRVAERDGNGTTYYWLLSDHLGSTSITAYSSGGKKAEVRYKAWGETRYTYGTTPTSQRYTGQREESSLGLYWYNSRWYSAGLGRFVSPDTIIPQPGSPQAWDRYSYTNNNPIRFTDPSGHVPVQGCGDEGKEACDPSWQEEAAYAYFVKKNEHTLCQSGNLTHCSSIEKGIVSNRPITGLHIGYSGQAGYLAEGGVYVQDDFLIDWATGTLYRVRTIGGFGYVGTPTALSGQVNFGFTDVKGIPRSWQDKDVRNALEGPQLDWAGALGVDAVAVLDVGTGRSYDLQPNGKLVNTNGYLMYSTSYDILFGIDSFPNLVDGGIQGGKSESFIVGVKKLWQRMII